MNFICATVLLKDVQEDPIDAFGLSYRTANAVVPNGGGNSEVRLQLLCFNRDGGKLDAFKAWEPGKRALVSGQLVFSEDFKGPLQLIISTIETNVPQDMYLNQVVLGNAFFKDSEVKVRKNNSVACKIGTTLDESDTKSFMFMELHESRQKKLEERIRAGRGLCISGYLREWHKDEDDSPYRAIVANDFSTRKDGGKRKEKATGSAAGYSEVDPTPDY